MEGEEVPGAVPQVGVSPDLHGQPAAHQLVEPVHKEAALAEAGVESLNLLDIELELKLLKVVFGHQRLQTGQTHVD